jgi:hypothetical protein
VIHLPAHREHLALDHFRKLGRIRIVFMRIGFGRQHRQRRFEEMREIGHMRARPAYNLLAVLDQGIEFASQGRDLGGKAAIQPSRLAVTDARQRLADPLQRQ